MDSSSFIKSPIDAELEDFRKLFDSSLSSSNFLLNNVIAHIRQRNGKMMRPILVLLVARLYGAIRPATFHAAVSLELLHTASLVHDDVVDESTERRGQLSVNAVFNNKVAVLAGDFLLATSLVHAGKTMSHEIISVVSCLGQDLADGELLQLSLRKSILMLFVKKRRPFLLLVLNQQPFLLMQAMKRRNFRVYLASILVSVSR